MLLVAVLGADVAACSVTTPCPGIEVCVSSQAEADQRNAGTSCHNYVYCPADAGADGSADGAATGDARSE
jgi:hypothetical protein